MNKTIIQATAAILSVICAACGSNNNQTEPDQTSDTQTTELVFSNKIDHVDNQDGISIYYAEDVIDGDTIIAFQDRANEMPIDLFIGSYDDSLLHQLLPEGSTKSAINVFLSESQGHYILFDAGLGTQAGGTLMDKLKAKNIKPTNIDAVCLTHLHFDHIGGLLTSGKATFPKATLYLSEKEQEAWSDQGPMAEQNGMWKQIQAAYKGRIKTFADGDTIIDGLIATLPTPGHTPGHTSYLIDGCLIMGDIIHAQDLQLTHPDFCAKYDQDPVTAVQTRKHILSLAAANGYLLCDAHCYDRFLYASPANPVSGLTY